MSNRRKSTPAAPPPTANTDSRPDVCMCDGKAGRRRTAAKPGIAKMTSVSHCEAVQILETTVVQMSRENIGFVNYAAFPPKPHALSRFPCTLGKRVASTRCSGETVQDHRELTGMTLGPTAMQPSGSNDEQDESLDRRRQCRETTQKTASSVIDDHRAKKVRQASSLPASRVAGKAVNEKGIVLRAEAEVGHGPSLAVSSFCVKAGLGPMNRHSQFVHPSLTIVSLSDIIYQQRGKKINSCATYYESDGRSAMSITESLSEKSVSSLKESRWPDAHSNTQLTPVRGEQKYEQGSSTRDERRASCLARQRCTSVAEQDITVQLGENSISSPSSASFQTLSESKPKNGGLTKPILDQLHYAEFAHSKFHRRSWRRRRRSKNCEMGSQCSVTTSASGVLDEGKA